MITACHNCVKGRGQHCLTCRRIDQDDIRIAHTPHNRDELTASTPVQPSEQVTGLPNDVENRLRQALMEIWRLKPIELLLVQHIILGRSFTSFDDELAKVANKIAKYRGSGKAKAKALSYAVRCKAPILKVIIEGFEKRMDKLDNEPTQDDLWAAAGHPLPVDDFKRRTPK